MLYKFELSHNAAKATKNIYAQQEDAADHYTRNKWFQTFRSGYINVD